MNFNNIKSFIVPEGEVYKLIYNGNVLWRKKRNFRYLKLVMDEIVNSSAKTIVQFSEVEFLDSNGVLFSFPASTVVTATIESSGGTEANPETESPDKLIDGTTETKFCSQAWVAGSYVLFDLGENESIDVFRYNIWRWYTANDTASFPERNLKTFSLYGSNDNSTWELLDSAKNYNATSENFSLAYIGIIA